MTGFLATGTFCGYVIILIATMAGECSKPHCNKLNLKVVKQPKIGLQVI